MIFKILSLLDSAENFLQICYRDFHLTLDVLLHYPAKSENQIYSCFKNNPFLFSYFFSNGSRLRCGGSYKSMCTTTTGSRTWKSCASVSRMNGTVCTSKWLTTRQWMAQATDSLHCSRQRTFWTFALNITAFVHIVINMFWTLLTLLSFV